MDENNTFPEEDSAIPDVDDYDDYDDRDDLEYHQRRLEEFKAMFSDNPIAEFLYSFHHDAATQQPDFEKKMVDRGVTRERNRSTARIENHQEAEGGAGRYLLVHTMHPLIEKISAFLEAAKKKPPTNRMDVVVVQMLERLGPKEAALIVGKTFIDRISSFTNYDNETVHSMAPRIARALLDELKFQKFRVEAPGLFEYKFRTFQENRTNSQDFMRQSLRASIGIQDIDISEFELSDAEQRKLGQVCINLFITATHYVELESAFSKTKTNKREVRVVLTAATQKWLDDHSSREYLERREHILWPLLIPPKPWGNADRGGYWFALENEFAITKRRTSADVVGVADMPLVYDALNALQNTPWRINQKVLRVINDVKRSGLVGAGIPTHTDEPEPIKPPDFHTNRDAKRRWKKKSEAVKTRNFILKGERTILGKKTLTAEALDDSGASCFYFPYNLDHRGRIYPISVYLTPQGNDVEKALLEFAEGQVLGSQEAVDWLAIHGANCMGDAPSGEKLDKSSFQARIDWVHANSDKIRMTAEDPVGMAYWWAHKDADAPFSFLAFCFEWSGYLAERHAYPETNGFRFASHLPIAMDGSCNGIQHYSALLRDEACAQEVNLIPSEKPQDIYGTVAGVVSKRLSDNGGPDRSDASAAIARDWISWGGVNRKFVKNPVMTLPYGSNEYSFHDKIEEFFDDQARKGKPLPSFMTTIDRKTGTRKRKSWHEGHHVNKHVNFMAKVIWEAIQSGPTSSAIACRDWFKKLVRLRLKDDNKKPISWTAPNGFRVVMDEKEQKIARIRTTFDEIRIDGRLRKNYESQMNTYESTNTQDRHKLENGIAPHIIHSLDASHLMMTVCAASQEGIRYFAMIHDSFGTHAANTPALARILRDQFVRLYTENDILAQLQSSILTAGDEKIDDPRVLPERPAAGTLDLSCVRKSKYFFG